MRFIMHSNISSYCVHGQLTVVAAVTNECLDWTAIESARKSGDKSP